MLVHVSPLSHQQLLLKMTTFHQAYRLYFCVAGPPEGGRRQPANESIANITFMLDERRLMRFCYAAGYIKLADIGSIK